MDKKNNLTLPEDLMVEILLRLPVKSLIRFKCVSKSWLSLISHPNFANSHFELAAAPTHRLLRISYWDHKALSIDIDSGSTSPKLTLSFPRNYFPFNQIQILGSCRGLILLDNGFGDLILWNPSTGFHRTLSYSPVVYMSKCKHKNMELLYGFGYDMATDDYVVVVASSAGAAGWLSYLELFSVRANSWKESKGILSHNIRFPRKDNWGEIGMPHVGLFFNGALHWLHLDRNGLSNEIIIFDLKERNFSKISLPDDMVGIWIYNPKLRIVGGCLGVFYYNKLKLKYNGAVNTWVMKEYKVSDSWVKFFVTNGGQIVTLDGGRELMKLDGRGLLLEHHTYTESLLSLPSECGEAKEDDRI